MDVNKLKTFHHHGCEQIENVSNINIFMNYSTAIPSLCIIVN